jgi:hypothetical protein
MLPRPLPESLQGGTLSPAYVDLVLDAVERLIEQAHQIQANTWHVLARHGRKAASGRAEIVITALVRAAELGRGPLLQVAFERLEARGLIRLHHLGELERAIAIESMMLALIVGTQRDVLTDSDRDALLALFEAEPPIR